MERPSCPLRKTALTHDPTQVWVVSPMEYWKSHLGSALESMTRQIHLTKGVGMLMPLARLGPLESH